MHDTQTMNTAAPLEDGDIRRIAVFRALGLGDLLCATPVLRSLKAAWPAAELTLIGLPWARELAARWGYVDRFEPFPGYPGLPEREPDVTALPGFIARMQRARYDLLVQLHGSGRITNPLLATFGARHLAGHREPDGWCSEPARHADWPEHGHEIERLLQVADRLGIARCGTRLDFPVDDDDRARLACTWPMLVRRDVRYACLHAGAQLASRRWVPERFAAVADALAERGYRVVLTGGPSEAALAARIRTAMQADAIDACGRTDLGLLGALIERARLLVCNDTGVSHIAAALGTRSVVVSCGADTMRWAPLDAQRHRVLWHDVPCRPCMHRECPVGHPCAWGVGSAEVIEAALAMADDAAPVGGLAASR